MMKKFLDAAIKNGAEKVESYLQKEMIDEITFESNRLKQIATKKVQGLSLQVVKDSNLGVVASSDLNNPDLLAKKAVELAEFGDKITYDFSKSGVYPEVQLTTEKVFAASVDELVTAGEKIIEKILSYDKKIQASVKIHRSRVTREICNTHGQNLSSSKYSYWAYGSGLLVENENFINTFVPLTEKNDMIDFDFIAEEIIKKFQIARNNVTLESGKYPVIFTPNAVAQIAFTLEALKGEHVASGISPLMTKKDQSIFAEQISIVDDGTLTRGIRSDRFDDEGTPTQKTILVENGVLKNFIYDLKSAAETNTKPTGNGWRLSGKYDRPIRVNFTNLLFSPGNCDLADLISEIKLGLMIDDISGLVMGNLIQGNIDSDIDMAYKIENGKITGRVKNGAIGTNVYQIFKDNLVAIENQIQSNMMGSIAVYTPHILCKDINITVG